MGRDDGKSGRGDPENKQRSPPRSSSARKQVGYLGRATANDAGHSGYGSESVRPYLRAQLRFKELMASPFAEGWKKLGKKTGKN
jgi:hypothetical protein